MALALWSCQTDTALHVYKSTGERGWAKVDTLCFRLPEELRGRDYVLELGIKHTAIYPYRDLWLELYMGEASIHPSGSDTVHIWLSDSLGRWTGKGTEATCFQYVTETIPCSLCVTDTIICLRHLMCDSILRGITDVGIRLSAFPGSVNTQKDKQQDGETP